MLNLIITAKIDKIKSQEQDLSISISPNPFSNTTNIQLILPNQQHIKLNLYDINGRGVRNLTNRTLNQGYHNLILDTSDLLSGFYYLNLQAATETITKKIVIWRN